MSSVLSELLGAREPLFTLALRQLEEASGNPGADIRLIAEIKKKAKIKIAELGLDPNDTTGKELYHTLLARVQKDDGQLVKAIGGNITDDIGTLMLLMKKAIEGFDIPKRCWVLRASVAKRLLKSMPPKRVMKLLGYRSVDSMLKRESVYELYGGLRFVESPQWLKRFTALYKQVGPSDFESRDINIVLLSEKRWGVPAKLFVHEHGHNITYLKELGVIYMLPMPIRHLPGITITVLPLLLHYLNEIRLYGAYFKLQQVKPNFGRVLTEALASEPSAAAVMAGTEVHWRVIQRYFGKPGRDYHPEVFEPHVQPEDLQWREPEEVLFQYGQRFKFWEGMNYVGVAYDKRPISFNLMDVAVSCLNRLEYGEQALYHFQSDLWDELCTRYVGQSKLEEQVLKQLDNELAITASMNPESLMNLSHETV